MTSKPDMGILYDYLFHYNPYEKLWYAFTRDQANSYFSESKKKLMSNSDIGELVTDILIKHQDNDR